MPPDVANCSLWEKIICFENQYLNMLIIVVSNSLYDNSNRYMVYEFFSHDFFVSSYCVFLCFCVLQYFWLKDDHAYRVIYRDNTFYTQILACFSFYQAFIVGVCVDLVRNWTRFEICLVAIVAMVTRVRICCYGYQSWNLLLPWSPEISKSSSDTLFLFLHLALDLSSVLLPPQSHSLAILPDVQTIFVQGLLAWLGQGTKIGRSLMFFISLNVNKYFELGLWGLLFITLLENHLRR